MALFEPPRAIDSREIILLNSNESAYGCSTHVIKALQDPAVSLNRYPAVETQALRERLASLHGAKPEQVVLGCGSSEILRMTALAFLGSGKRVVVGSPTYEAIGRYAKSMGTEVAEVRLNRDWAHDLPEMLARTDGRTSLIYICNPNNPTGSITPRKDIESFLAKLPSSSHVLIDEAYHHYMNPSGLYTSFLDHPADNPRVIVTRTFSKVYGLAGMRIGYGITSPEVAERIRIHQLYFSVSVASARAALAALDDTATVELNAKRNADDRQEFFNQANARMLRAIDSHTNFVMMNTGHPAEETIEHFRTHDVLIGRKFPPLDTYIRVSLGRPEEMEQFWRVWDLRPGAMSM
jgi:histidinol-phosphate aminotransferase